MKITTKILTRSAVLLALALVVQLGKFPQPVTGPAINGILFIASAVVGPISGILIGLLTPIVAFAVGIMPFAPAMVIIMLGNATLAIVYGLLAKRQILALVAAAVGKFLVMAAMVKYIFPLLFGIAIPAKVTTMLTLPQLYTALIGAVAAFIILKLISHLFKKDNA
ncbi:MAG: ECF transporter S component [Peptococcia bacterium]